MVKGGGDGGDGDGKGKILRIRVGGFICIFFLYNVRPALFVHVANNAVIRIENCGSILSTPYAEMGDLQLIGSKIIGI
jgi:uncharacterized membrane protein